MDLHDVALGERPLVAYHDHNAEQARPRILAWIAEGASVLYASDAGTPLIADPGWKLARAVRDAGGAVTALPGPCAAIDALVLSGAPTDAFSFLGFPPPKSAARRRFFERWRGAPGALVLYESPRRLAECLDDAASVFGAREAAVARELTKMFEEVRRGPLDGLAAAYRDSGPPRGEIVIVIDPAAPDEADPDAIAEALTTALKTASVRDAATAVAEAFHAPRKTVYTMALEISRNSDSMDDDA
jgi:16S rRNA (cytidine1402-2'-O)-methyltransferase